jgi:hypothetical protein
MAVQDNDRMNVPSHVYAREFDGETVLLDLSKGDYFGLDELGARLWRGLAEGRSTREVAEEVAPEYEVDFARLLADLTDLATELASRGLLVPTQPSP